MNITQETKDLFAELIYEAYQDGSAYDTVEFGMNGDWDAFKQAFTALFNRDIDNFYQ